MIRKMLVGAALVSSALWGLGGAAVDAFFCYSLPRTPNRGTGAVYRLVVSHGFVRFGTRGDVRMLRAMRDGAPVAALVFVAAVLVGLGWGVLRVRGNDGGRDRGPGSPP